MKKITSILLLTAIIGCFFISCDEVNKNTTAITEQALTEANQTNLLKVQPPPKLTWSLERDNLIKRFKLQNDRTITFFMYVFIEGISEPIGYYEVNKVSSVNSQLTNTEQLAQGDYGERMGDFVLPSPAEDGSYGTNGDAIFGFTPEEIYIQTNMKYITSTVPLHFKNAVNKLAIIDTDLAKSLIAASKKVMNK